MKLEKIIKRPSGARFKIEVSLYVDNYRTYPKGKQYKYECRSMFCAPGKRKFRAPEDETEKPSPGEIEQVKIQLWESIMP